MPIDFPELGNATVRGFYTTRIVDADDCDQAGPLAADSIHKELSESFVKALGYTLEIESCEDVTGVVDPGPRRGFSFFTEE